MSNIENLHCKHSSISTTSSLADWIQIEAGITVKTPWRGNWYMTHTLPISSTQKKEHILMVKKRNSALWCLYSGCVHDWEKESPDLFAELNVYVWTHIKQLFKPESPAACKLNWSLGVTTCFAIPWNAYQSYLSSEPVGPASYSVVVVVQGDRGHCLCSM